MDIVERKFAPATALALMRRGVPALLARILAARGVGPGLPARVGAAALLPGEALHNCVEMARLLADAVTANDRLLIVADYDADGATACAIGMRGLRAYGANVGFLIPNRVEHGYGLTPDIVAIAANLVPKPRFIVTVDNGISSIEGVAAARRLGIEVLVTDHHLAPAVLPEARLIVNPNQPACGFPSKSLAGCGVMWYVVRALAAEMRDRGIPALDPEFDPDALLPLAAIGTIADVVSLDDNNRVLVREGLDRIRAGRSFAGIEALARVGKRNVRELTTSDIGFGIGPRINAAGRLESMDQGVECLLTDSASVAEALATRLHEINDRRKGIEAQTVDQAVAQLATSIGPDRYTVVLHDERWHAGVIGIVAGRLREKVYRPTFVLASGSNGELKGSGRSIPGFHLRDALDLVDKRQPGLLRKFGGHAMAAGVTLRSDGLAEFEQAFEAVGRELLSPALLRQTIETDGTLEPDEMTLDVVEMLRKEVWGSGFPEPAFCDTFKVVQWQRMGTEKEHVRLVVEKRGQHFTAVKFRHEDSSQPDRIRMVYKLDSNTFRETTSLQLLVDYLEPA